MKLPRRPTIIITVSLVSLMGLGGASALYVANKPNPKVTATVKPEPSIKATTDSPLVGSTTEDTSVEPTGTTVAQPTQDLTPAVTTPDLMTRAQEAVLANMKTYIPASEIDNSSDWRQWYCFQQMITSDNGPGFTDEMATMAFIEKYRNLYFPVPCQTQRWGPTNTN